MNGHQLARLSVLLQFISSFSGSVSMCPQVDVTNPAALVPLVAVCECKARIYGWHIRHKTCPDEIRFSAGWLPLSVGHCRRMCAILRSESWRQTRYLKDCLRVACSSEVGGRTNWKVYRDWSDCAVNPTEVMWRQVWTSLPKKGKSLRGAREVANSWQHTRGRRAATSTEIGPKVLH